MSHVKILVHCVWRVKNNQPLLIPEKRSLLFTHILENAKKKDIFIDTLGGYTDHVHCLISLGTKQSIADTLQLIKGESTYWANKENLFTHKLEWAEDYFAASVNMANVSKVRDYIKNQEDHHKKKTFKEEYENFLRSHGFQLG